MRDFSQRIEDCAIATLWRKPESVITDTPSLFKVENEAAPFEFMNGIYRTQLSSAECAIELRRQFESFASKKLSFRWFVYPHSTPRDLESRLNEWRPSAVTASKGLYVDVDHFDSSMPSDVTVEELSRNNLIEYAQANVDGWSLSGTEAERLKEDIAADFEKGVGYRAYLARYRGMPASTGRLLVVNGDGYLMGGSSRPQFRGNGVYTGLVRHRIKVLKQQGVKLALVSARGDTAAPICERIGFKVGCELRTFSFRM